MTLTERDELALVRLSRAADGRVPRRLERVAKMVLDRDDAAAMLVRSIAANNWEAWMQAREILLRRAGDPFALLDLAVELGQVERERRGEARSWEWPAVVGPRPGPP
jgi:hypothetical protein